MARAADGPRGQSAWHLYFRFGARRTVRGRGGDRRAGLAGEAAGGARLAVVRGAVAAGGPCHAIRRRGAAAAVLPPRHELRLGGADGMGEPRFSAYQPLEIWLMVVLAAAFSLQWRLPATRLVMLLLLLHMALQHRRHVEILGLIAPLLLAPALADQLPDRPGGSPLLQWVDHAIAELKKPATCSASRWRSSSLRC